MRNPTWTRDELILALDLYMRFPDTLPNQMSPEVVELSATLNALGRVLGKAGDGTFRNPNGVYMKLNNFKRLDARYTNQGHVGLPRGGKGDVLVWNEFAEDPDRLREVASAIMAATAGIGQEANEPPEPEEEFSEAPEGRLLTRLHIRRERNRKLVRRRKEKALNEHGRLDCEACGFDFERAYGERGSGFIECHHTKPVHTLVEGSRTKLEDLALLCANCHRMVHASRPWLSVDELRWLVNRVPAQP